MDPRSKRETTLTVEKKSFVLVLPYLGSISLQTRTKLKRSLKIILLQMVFKRKPILGNNVHFKDRIPKILILVSFISFSVDSAISPIIVVYFLQDVTKCDSFSEAECSYFSAVSRS